MCARTDTELIETVGRVVRTVFSLMARRSAISRCSSLYVIKPQVLAARAATCAANTATQRPFHQASEFSRIHLNIVPRRLVLAQGCGTRVELRRTLLRKCRRQEAVLVDRRDFVCREWRIRVGVRTGRVKRDIRRRARA